ncbi:uncharacterized protein LOC131238821 [Magnolia sinica]|uniref:uncharacterized protein LOC131238821 n=1 Tax=Magnolia sinica TaxID=86752 RepID=UPI00265B3F68|nr:uncharacterized protein LOC131238821 [Magnolia sinica]
MERVRSLCTGTRRPGQTASDRGKTEGGKDFPLSVFKFPFSRTDGRTGSLLGNLWPIIMAPMNDPNRPYSREHKPCEPSFNRWIARTYAQSQPQIRVKAHAFQKRKPVSVRQLSPDLTRSRLLWDVPATEKERVSERKKKKKGEEEEEREDKELGLGGCRVDSIEIESSRVKWAWGWSRPCWTLQHGVRVKKDGWLLHLSSRLGLSWFKLRRTIGTRSDRSNQLIHTFRSYEEVDLHPKSYHDFRVELKFVYQFSSYLAVFTYDMIFGWSRICMLFVSSSAVSVVP